MKPLALEQTEITVVNRPELSDEFAADSSRREINVNLNRRCRHGDN